MWNALRTMATGRRHETDAQYMVLITSATGSRAYWIFITARYMNCVNAMTMGPSKSSRQAWLQASLTPRWTSADEQKMILRVPSAKEGLHCVPRVC